MSRASTSSSSSSSPSSFQMTNDFSKLESFLFSSSTNYPGSPNALQMICACDSVNLYVEKQNYSGVITQMRLDKKYVESLLHAEHRIEEQIGRTNELAQAIKHQNLTFDEAMSILAAENKMIVFDGNLRLGFQSHLYNFGENQIRSSCTFRHYREATVHGIEKRYFSNEGSLFVE